MSGKEYNKIITDEQICLNQNISTQDISEIITQVSSAMLAKLGIECVRSFFGFIGSTIHLGIRSWMIVIEWIFFIICMCIACVIAYIIYLGEGWKKYPSTYNSTCNILSDPYCKKSKYSCPFLAKEHEAEEPIVGIVLQGKMDFNEELNKLTDYLCERNISTQPVVNTDPGTKQESV